VRLARRGVDVALLVVAEETAMMTRASGGTIINKRFINENRRIRFALNRVERVAERLFAAFRFQRRRGRAVLPDESSPVGSGRHTEAMSAALRRARMTSIHIGSCGAETIVATTASSVYELIVVRGDCGEVLVRGGQQFTEFCSVLFVGSLGNCGTVQRHTLGIGLRMKFHAGARIIVTSAVQSLSGTLPGQRDVHASVALETLRRPAKDATHE